MMMILQGMEKTYASSNLQFFSPMFLSEFITLKHSLSSACKYTAKILTTQERVASHMGDSLNAHKQMKTAQVD